MEARFLQIELEALHKDDCVFLDSDDLRDLSKLIHHVQQSRCLVLVQTRRVLTRPFCLIELLTAIESQIPIVCVTVGGKPEEIAYNYEEMTKLMMWMDTELEQWNPGAADVLRDHGYEDLTDVAYRLSTIIPKTISVQLNTGDSRNRLHATIEDVVSAMQEAKVPHLPDKAAWLTARSKMAPPLSSAPYLRKRSNSMPAVRPAVYEHSGGSAGGDGDDGGDDGGEREGALRAGVHGGDRGDRLLERRLLLRADRRLRRRLRVHPAHLLVGAGHHDHRRLR